MLYNRKNAIFSRLRIFNHYSNFVQMVFFIACLFESRLKRDSTKLNTEDMLALLTFLEANRHNNQRYNEEPNNINALEYQKPYYGSPYGNIDLDDDDGDGVSGDEWWNELIEPSVQYYGNPYGHIEQTPRDRHSKGIIFDSFLLYLNKHSTSRNF